MIEFKPLALKLLKFSQYKVCDKKGAAISCSSTIKKLQELRDSGDESKKYITTFIISEDKVIDRIDRRLDKFKLQFFNPYAKEKENLRVLSYCFDISDKKDLEKYHTFLVTCGQAELKEKAKKDLERLKYYIAPLFALFSGLTLFFTYLGFSEYGIPDSYISDIASISFLMIATLVFILLVFMLAFGLSLYLMIPLLLCSILGCTFSIYIIFILSYLILFLIVLLKKYPLFLSEIHKVFITLMRGMTVAVVVGGILFIGFIMSQSILSTFFKNSKFYDKTGYQMIVSIYFTNYLGYPKILKKGSKYYYLPVKDNRYYYVYNIEEVKEKYISDLKKNVRKIAKICKDKNTKLAFLNSYILDNQYIKPKYLKEQFLIKDTNVTIEDFDMHKLINKNDIKKLCKK